ncbi:MAG: alpha-hydroxy acid oxidase [Dehalococcoidia bacterium]
MWFKPPTILSAEHAHRVAKRKLPTSVYQMIEGGTEQEHTRDANRAGFEEIGFRARVFDAHVPRDLTTTVFGREIAMPVFPTPAGFLRMAHPDAELAVAKAAAAYGVPMGLGILSSASVEDVVKVNDNVWFQLYMIGGREGSQVAIERAQAAGCRALFVTVDFASSTGARERFNAMKGVPGRVDLRTAIRYAPEMLLRPEWALKFVKGGLDLKFPNAPRTAQGEVLTAAHAAMSIVAYPPTWEDLAWVRKVWRGPLIIKGITDPADARKAIDIGADGISVSNHGGNGLDDSPATIRALPAMVEAADGKLEVLLDGGVRRGGDVVKAVALGAKAVMFGRPYFWSLAAAGEKGVHQMLGIYKRGINGTLMNLGCPSVSALDPSYLRLPRDHPGARRD